MRILRKLEEKMKGKKRKIERCSIIVRIMKEIRIGEMREEN